VNKKDIRLLLGFAMGMTLEEVINLIDLIPAADDVTLTQPMLKEALKDRPPFGIPHPERVATAFVQVVEAWPK